MSHTQPLASAKLSRAEILKKLSSTHFDILVIGGGICGSAIARAGACAGLSVALIEKSDFASGASGNSLRIAHGGLRYLQQFDVARMRQSIRARRRWLRIAPHLIRPLSCAIGLNGKGTRHPIPSAIALAISDIIAWDRNKGLLPTHHLKRSRVVNKRNLNAIAPGAFNEDIMAGAVWSDGLLCDPKRLVLELALATTHFGGTVINHVECCSLTFSGKRISGVTAIDRLGGESLEIATNTVVDTSGWQTGHLGGVPQHTLTSSHQNKTTHWIGAANIFVDNKPYPEHAVGISGEEQTQGSELPSRREFFLVPQTNGTLIGTSYLDIERATGEGQSALPAHLGQTRTRACRQLVEEINRTLPNLSLSVEDVRFNHFGLLPGDPPDGVRSASQRLWRHEVIDDRIHCRSVEGFYRVTSVKWTTALEIADAVIGRVLKSLGRTRVNDVPEALLPGAANGVPTGGTDTLSHYGSLARHIEAVFANVTVADQALTRNQVAELIYAMRHELAATACDGYERIIAPEHRCETDTATHSAIVSVMAKEAGWGHERVEVELASLRAPSVST